MEVRSCHFSTQHIPMVSGILAIKAQCPGPYKPFSFLALQPHLLSYSHFPKKPRSSSPQGLAVTAPFAQNKHSNPHIMISLAIGVCLNYTFLGRTFLVGPFLIPLFTLLSFFSRCFSIYTYKVTYSIWKCIIYLIMLWSYIYIICTLYNYLFIVCLSP